VVDIYTKAEIIALGDPNLSALRLREESDVLSRFGSFVRLGYLRGEEELCGCA